MERIESGVTYLRKESIVLRDRSHRELLELKVNA